MIQEKKQEIEHKDGGEGEVNPPDEASTFASLGVCEELCLACESLNWSAPTPIQIAAIPPALKGRDIIGLAETGSGKTAAFALPVLQGLLDSASANGVRSCSFFCLVLAPTRELSMQISDQFQALGASIQLKVCVLIGGLDMVSQAIELAKRPHIIIGTPGRIVDHLENTKGFHLRYLNYLVMDEADRLLSMDFEDAIDKILELIPKQRKTFLFSATMTTRVSKLQRASLSKPIKLNINTKYETNQNLKQFMKLVEDNMKIVFAVSLMGHFKNYSAIIFVNRCDTCVLLTNTLRQLGFHAISLHGRIAQSQRLGALNSFRSGQKKILVATEVGSRGLDIPQVDLVLNYDVPLSSKDYIHRVGRTARAGRTGYAITLVTQYDVENYYKIESSLNKKLQVYDEIDEKQWRSLNDKVKEAFHLAKLEGANERQSSKKLRDKKKKRRK